MNFKKPILFVLIAFWSFSWHSYAASCRIAAQPSGMSVKAADSVSAGFVNKSAFKKRPFIDRIWSVAPDCAPVFGLPAPVHGMVRVPSLLMVSHEFRFDRPLRAPPVLA